MLAQHWLHGRRAKTQWDDLVSDRLLLPSEFNPHSGVGALNKLAERIVFTDDVPSLLYEMHDNKQLTYEGIVSTTYLPYDCFWIEYTTTLDITALSGVSRLHYGALVERLLNDNVRMYIVTGMDFYDRETVSGLVYIVEFTEWPLNVKDKKSIEYYVRWSFNNMDNNDQSMVLDLGTTINELIFGIFLVTQPKVYKEELVTYKPSHKRARAAKGKPPLLEYRKLRVHIGQVHKRYTQRPASGLRTVVDDYASDIVHRRYHKVMGHFRHYVHDDNPRTVWISPHYRGDPKLGATFIERDVSK